MKTTRTASAAVSLFALLALTATGCSEEDTNKAKDTAASATAKAGDAVASATAAASDKMAEVKDGTDAKGEVKAGATKASGDRTSAQVTVDNGTDETHDYTITVNFRDAAGGNLLDAVVVRVKDVAPGKSTDATARSNRTLKGNIKAEIGAALRH
ncbi:hypothetical protein [Streptomyces sp. A5-4]|uniref:hypothetical protein n=1 Tax=Streptomyces sp. A5-4 TaxID=3384771 RepID=UPI003DA8548A